MTYDNHYAIGVVKRNRSLPKKIRLEVVLIGKLPSIINNHYKCNNNLIIFIDELIVKLEMIKYARDMVRNHFIYKVSLNYILYLSVK